MTAKRRRPTILGQILKFAIPLIVSVGLCYVLFRKIDFAEMMEIIRRDCDFSWIALSLCVGLLSFLFRALRWGIQLRAVGINAPLTALLLSIFGTYAVNIVFPRLGEVWRTGYIAGRQHAPFATVFGSMLADRLADLVTVALITLGTLFVARGALTDFVKSYPDTYNALIGLVTSPWVWGLIGAIAVALVIVLRRRTGNAVIIRIRGLIKELWNGFSAIARMDGKGRWVLLTVLLWGTYYVELGIAFQAFPFTREIFDSYGWSAVLVCFVLTSISMGIPSNGGIGPYQIAMIFGLSLYVPSAMTDAESSLFMVRATAFGNIVLGTQTLLMIALGLFTFASIAVSRRRRRAA